MKNPQLHTPVLLEESTELLLNLNPKNFLDATLGFSGHAHYVLSKLSSNASFYGIDQDPVALNYSMSKIGEDPRVTIIDSNFSKISTIAKSYNCEPFDACLVDCGISSVQLDSLDRGFSFQTEGPLDMRMSPDFSLNAADILNTYSFDKLNYIFNTYGECRYVDKFIDNILIKREKKPFETVPDLIAVIKKSFFFYNKRSNFIKMCTKVFQALRIEVNSELDVLQQFLHDIIPLLTIGGRCSVITFHSLEDRLLKRFIRDHKAIIQPVNKRVIQLTYHEAKKNTRARSAKCRVFERVR